MARLIVIGGAEVLHSHSLVSEAYGFLHVELLFDWTSFFRRGKQILACNHYG